MRAPAARTAALAAVPLALMLVALGQVGAAADGVQPGAGEPGPVLVDPPATAAQPVGPLAEPKVLDPTAAAQPAGPAVRPVARADSVPAAEPAVGVDGADGPGGRTDSGGVDGADRPGGRAD